jgi:hypothetical protein
MSKTFEGIYRAGKIELLETISEVKENARVLVIFISDGSGQHIIEKRTARAHQNRRAENWEQSEMDIYDELFGPLTRRE